MRIEISVGAAYDFRPTGLLWVCLYPMYFIIILTLKELKLKLNY